jgi:hypothetical protein
VFIDYLAATPDFEIGLPGEMMFRERPIFKETPVFRERAIKLEATLSQASLRPRRQHRMIDLVDDLESLAIDFQEALYDRDLIQDRMFGLIKYPNVFLGKDAVDVLVELLQEYNEGCLGTRDSTVARDGALEVGRAIAVEYELFESAFVMKNLDHELNDGKQFYKLKNNLPCEVANTTRNMSTLDKLRVMRKYVTIQDRMYRLRTYPRCFVGSEAVDVLMKKKIAISRQKAVKLVNKMNHEFHCFDHVADKGKKFEDGNSFYRFLPDEELMKEHGAKVKALNSIFDALTGNEGMTTEFDLAGGSSHRS